MEGMRLVCCCVWTGEELDLKGKAVCYGEAGEYGKGVGRLQS